MVANIIDEIRTERAKFARDTEYIRESVIEDIIDERTEVAESLYVRETAEELQEAADLVNTISGEPDMMQESAEVERILSAEENITFDEMAGIE